jgi:hypothetical protein
MKVEIFTQYCKSRNIHVLESESALPLGTRILYRCPHSETPSLLRGSAKTDFYHPYKAGSHIDSSKPSPLSDCCSEAQKWTFNWVSDFGECEKLSLMIVCRIRTRERIVSIWAQKRGNTATLENLARTCGELDQTHSQWVILVGCVVHEGVGRNKWGRRTRE